MEVSLILKVGGIGFLVSVIYQILSKSGREEQALLVSVSGMILVLLLLIGQMGDLIGAVREVFGL
ncbi:MAG: stage III sporulation protein AC [Clostridia bacterium]|nr:stage III sporulation protein AC [Clostridia bacterium]